MVLGFALTLNLTLPYKFDNLLETQSLVPNLTIDKQTKDQMATNVTSTSHTMLLSRSFPILNFLSPFFALGP
jgi:hypothetical protein